MNYKRILPINDQKQRRCRDSLAKVDSCVLAPSVGNFRLSHAVLAVQVRPA